MAISPLPVHAWKRTHDGALLARGGKSRRSWGTASREVSSVGLIEVALVAGPRLLQIRHPVTSVPACCATPLSAWMMDDIAAPTVGRNRCNSFGFIVRLLRLDEVAIKA